MEKEIVDKKIVVLKPQISKSDVEEIVEKKKTGLFGSVFSRPKPEEIEVSSIGLFYEPYWIVGGSYAGDYFRKSEYKVTTDPTVKEVRIGEGVFPVEEKSGTWSKIRSGMTGSQKENHLSIPVEEHVVIDIEDEVILNMHGNETKLDYKIESKHAENFPDKVLDENKTNVRESLTGQDDVVEKLVKILTEDTEKDVKMVKEKIIVDRLDEVFIPVFEARCTDTKNKIEILRIDAISKKVIG